MVMHSHNYLLQFLSIICWPLVSLTVKIISPKAKIMSNFSMLVEVDDE
jgi:hypothetical protein